MKVYEQLTPKAFRGSSELTWVEQKLVSVLNANLKNAIGSLTLTLPSGHQVSFGDKQPVADVKLESYRPLLRLFFGGINGWSESYLAGEWVSSDLTSLVRWALRNEPQLNQLSKAGFVTQSLHNVYHWYRDNSRKGSRRNIAAHYDLGNEFYSRWLDPSMTYSAALYQTPEQSLEAAQYSKNARILELLNADAGDQIVEIGCGWGGFSAQAAQTKNLNVHGITLSKEQLTWAKHAISAAHLEQQVHLSLTDYRDLVHQYDGVVSIEMFEAVGEAHWDTYFNTLKRVLKPGGNAVLQVITIDDERFHSYRKQADFIQRYVFPGGMLPSVEALKAKIEQHGFTLTQQQMFGKDYAQTLREWRYAFENNWPQIIQLGFDEQFYRLWRYYLAYCEGGFEEGTVDVGLFVLTQSNSTSSS